MNIRQLFKVSPRGNCCSAAILLVRVVAGAAFMHHGFGKIQSPFDWMGAEAPVPGLFQALAALSEFGGGLAWILGLLMPLASFGLVCTMAVAVFTHAIVKGDPFVGSGGSYELASLYLCLAVLFIAIGPGKFSLDQRVFGSR